MLHKISGTSRNKSFLQSQNTTWLSS